MKALRLAKILIASQLIAAASFAADIRVSNPTDLLGSLKGKKKSDDCVLHPENCVNSVVIGPGDLLDDDLKIVFNKRGPKEKLGTAPAPKNISNEDLAKILALSPEEDALTLEMETKTGQICECVNPRKQSSDGARQKMKAGHPICDLSAPIGRSTQDALNLLQELEKNISEACKVYRQEKREELRASLLLLPRRK